jgi:3-methylfumaryl-CoA hydratase
MNVPARRFRWSPVDLFRFSAATGNSHRIHYDVEHARAEGLDGVVVHTTLHALMLWQTLTAVVGEIAVHTFEWRNHAPLVADREVEVRATAEPHEDGWRVTLTEHACDDGTLLCSGVALVRGA